MKANRPAHAGFGSGVPDVVGNPNMFGVDAVEGSMEIPDGRSKLVAASVVLIDRRDS